MMTEERLWLVLRYTLDGERAAYACWYGALLRRGRISESEHEFLVGSLTQLADLRGTVAS